MEKKIRNFVARDAIGKCKSRKFKDRRDRRAKDAKKSWKREEF